MLDQLLKMIQEEQGKNKELVAKMPLDLHKEHKKYLKEKIKLSEDMDTRIQELALQTKRALRQEFGSRMERMDELHEELWDKTYRELNLDPTQEYEANASTGAIYKETENKGKKISDFPFDFKVERQYKH